MEMTEADRAIIDFESRWGEHTAAKEDAIRTELRLTSARFYQRLGRLIDTTGAQAYAPMLVKRLRRVRDRTPRLHG